MFNKVSLLDLSDKLDRTCDPISPFLQEHLLGIYLYKFPLHNVFQLWGSMSFLVLFLHPTRKMTDYRC